MTVEEAPERLDLRSADITSDKIERLLELFPEARTEGGRIDFDRLELALGEAVDVGRERYGLTWPGKADCFRTIQTPSLATLRPARDESVAWDTTENLIIEGDNLEVLKLLQKSYLGKVKMIYIDPPYNTGNDFIYPDNYTESLKTYLEYTGQVDAEGRKFSTNTDTDGRFHSKWLNMMYPRLYLARNLLRDDGVIFASIDDHEVENLRRLCDEIFGEENFVACFPWKGRGGRQDATHVADVHEYVVTYARRASALVTGRQAVENAIYSKVDVDSGRRYKLQLARKWGSNSRREDRPNLFYPVKAPDGQLVYPLLPNGADGCWRWGKARMASEIELGHVEFLREQGGWQVYERIFEPGDGEGLTKKSTTWLDDAGSNASGTKAMALLFGELDRSPFSYPKPVELLHRMLQIGNVRGGDIVLDFFAGSGTTAHAVLDLNKQDGGNRKFILVQLPEPTEREDYPTIADITKERVRRVIAKLDAEDHNEAGQDRGFRVFKLDESNILPWDAGIAHDEAAIVEQLQLHVDHLRDDRSADDVLFEILLKTGFPVSTRIDSIEIAGTRVSSIADGALLICLSQTLSLELMRGIVELKPERVVFLDEAFADEDALKANASHLFKAAGITFRTV